MSRRRGLSCSDVLVCLDVLSDIDSEREDDIEDSLSWDESEPESNEMSDSYSEISASESDLEEEQNGDCREMLGKDGYVWSPFFYSGVKLNPWYYLCNFFHGTIAGLNTYIMNF